MKQKKPPHPPVSTAKIGETIKSIGSAFKEVAVFAAAHPTTAALFIMGGTTLIQCALKASENKGNKTAKDINFQMGGLYSGAQGIAAASVVAPVIMAGITTAGATVAKVYGKP